MAKNVLITSISKKIPLLFSIKRALHFIDPKGEVFGADSNAACIGRYFVDKFLEIEKLDTLKIKKFIDICKKNNIDTHIPTRDGELLFFAQHKEELLKHGIKTMISPLHTIETCIDKLLFHKFLTKHHFPTMPTALQLDEIKKGPFVVKERRGAGSEKIGLNLSREQAAKWQKNLTNPLFQQYIPGTEYSVDIYVNKNGKAHGVIARERELIVHGESQITASIKDKEMEALCIALAEKLGIYGHAVIQLMKDPTGKLYIIECNPRFGGASTLSEAMGLHSFKWFLLESEEKKLPRFIRKRKELRQIRYPADLLMDKGAL